jgi:lipoate---protein ligase
MRVAEKCGLFPRKKEALTFRGAGSLPNHNSLRWQNPVANVRVVDWLFLDPGTQSRHTFECLARESELHDRAEAGAGEYLWIWEVDEPAIVMGHSADCMFEVQQEACEQAGVPILRRVSGGRTVLLNKGCLNYTLILRLDGRSVDESYRLILGAVLDATGVTNARCEAADLTVGNRKFAGCAQRRRRHTLLHHGTILYDFDIAAVARFLAMPRRQPAYRMGRSHNDFLTNVDVHPDFAQRLSARFPKAVVVA